VVATTGYSGGVAIAALAGQGADLTFRAVLLVNTNATAAAAVTVQLSQYVCNCMGSQAMQRYAYDPANVPPSGAAPLPLPPSGTYDGSGAPLTDTVPAGGVVVWSTYVA